jgi:hypothetical protein
MVAPAAVVTMTSSGRQERFRLLCSVGATIDPDSLHQQQGTIPAAMA